MRGRHWVWVVCWVWGVVWGCATSRESEVWHRWLLEADADHDHGDFRRARSIYERLAPEAPDDNLGRYIAYKLALLDAEEGDTAGALQKLRALAEGPNATADAWSSQSLMAIAQILEAGGDAEGGLAVKVELVRRFPDDPVTPRALNDVLLDYRAKQDLEGAQAWLATLFALHAETDLGDNILYEVARIELEDRKRPAEAEALLRRHQGAYPFSGLHDDVTFKLAVLLDGQGRADEALEQLEVLAATQDEAWSVGSYDPKLRDDAMLLRAEIFKRTGRAQEAFDEYARLLSTFPDYLGGSRIARDQVDLLREPLADRARYIQALETFLSDYSDSVYVEDLRCRLVLARDGEPLSEIAAKAKALKPCVLPGAAE